MIPLETKIKTMCNVNLHRESQGGIVMVERLDLQCKRLMIFVCLFDGV